MIDGALLLDKPLGLSSNRALQEAKQLLGANKAGHGGTLDPLASGLLIVLFGEATKFAGPMLDADKEYLASVKLGITTSTADAEGEVLVERPVRVTRPELEQALARFRGAIAQVPPMHSALKRDGVPLYKLARAGQTVERQPREVQIHELELLGFDAPLAEDIGSALGTGAHLAALRRTASGRFNVREATALEALRVMPNRRLAVLPLAALLEGLQSARLDAADEARLRNGQPLKISGLEEGLCALYGANGAVIGLGSAQAEGVLRALRLTRGLTQAAEKHPKTL